jgi:hypothetical protein
MSRLHYPQYRPLSQEKVLELARKYRNIKSINYLCPTTIIIQTKFDTFFCDITDKYLVLKHQVSLKKQHAHFQRKFYDFPYLFSSLKKHDTYKFTKRGTCKLNHLYAQISGK